MLHHIGKISVAYEKFLILRLTLSRTGRGGVAPEVNSLMKITKWSECEGDIPVTDHSLRQGRPVLIFAVTLIVTATTHARSRACIMHAERTLTLTSYPRNTTQIALT